MKNKRRSDSDDEMGEERINKVPKIVRKYESDESEDEQIRRAFDNGTKVIKIGLSGLEGEVPTKHSILKNVFKNILHKEDEIIVTRTKKLIIITQHLESAIKVINLKHINETRIKAAVFEDSLTSQYIIKGVDQDISVEEIAQSLAIEGIYVRKVIRFNNKSNGEPSQTVLIKELGKVVRERVKFDHRSFTVQKFIEKPRICFKCLKLGHFQQTCSVTDHRCNRCGENHHPKECPNELKCFRCGGTDHNALNPRCPILKKESEVMELAKSRSLSIQEARRCVESTGASYREVTESRPKESSQVLNLSKIIIELKESVVNLTKITQSLISTKEPSGSIAKITDSVTESTVMQETLTKVITETINRPLENITATIGTLAQTLQHWVQNLSGGQDKTVENLSQVPGTSAKHLTSRDRRVGNTKKDENNI